MKRVVVMLLTMIFAFTMLASTGCMSFKSTQNVQELTDYRDIVVFLENGGDPFDALIEAICMGDHRAVELAIEYGADANAECETTSSLYAGEKVVPLLVAMDTGDRSIAQVLIDNGADVDYVDEQGQSLLMISANRLNVSFCGVLLENGADVNFENENGNTALSEAVSNDYNDEYATKVLVELLLDYGAVPNEKVFENLSKDGQESSYPYNLLSLLVKNAEERVIVDEGVRIGFGIDPFYLFQAGLPKYKEMNDSDFEVFLLLASANNVEAIEYYLSRKESIDRSNHYGTTLLSAAASAGALDVVQLLVENGATLNCLDCEGETGVVKAREMGETEIVEYLMDCQRR